MTACRVFLGLLVSTVVAAHTAGAAESQGSQDPDGKEIIVGFKKSAFQSPLQASAFARDLEQRFQAKATEISWHSGMIILSYHDAAELVRQLSTLPEVEYAELNRSLDQTAEPADELYPDGALCAPAEAAADGQWGLRKIDAPRAWDKPETARQVNVAVIDSGVDVQHEDLIDSIEPGGQSIINGRVSSNLRPATNHGTYVSGIIAAATNNPPTGPAIKVGVAGMSWRWKVKVLPMRFIKPSGSGKISDAVAAIRYVLGPAGQSPKAEVINASWGIYGESAALRAAVKEAADKRVVIVASAGNRRQDLDDNATPPFYPAYYSKAHPDDGGTAAVSKYVISVMATDRNDAPHSTSNFGRTTVDLAAPGVQVCTTRPNLARANVSEYWAPSGTSMAAPFVSGAVALMIANGVAAADIKARVRQAVDSYANVPAHPLYQKNETSGRLNLCKALRYGEAGACEAAITARGWR